MSRSRPGRMLISRLCGTDALVSAACDFILGAAPPAATKGHFRLRRTVARSLSSYQATTGIPRYGSDVRRPMKYLMRSFTVLTLLLVVAALAATPAFGSAIIGRNVTGATLSIDRHGHAHVSYRSGGLRRFLVASGAINARAPSQSRSQVKFRIRYGVGGRGA